MRTRLFASVLSAVSLSIAFVGLAAAQSYPAKPIKVIVPVAAGSGLDVVARFATEKMSQNMGATLYIENLPGANSNVGAGAAARAAPDGYTLLIATEALPLSRLTYSNLTYDLMRDLELFGTIAKGVFILCVNPSVPAQTVEEFVQLVRAKPGSIAYGSSGSGSPHHVVMEMFAQANGLNMLHVPYKGSGDTVTALLGGTLQAAMGLPSSFAPHVRSGKFRALAVSSAKRVPAFPEIPTLMERAVNGVEYESWYGMFAPTGTPRPVIERLHAELSKVVRDKAYVEERLGKIGLEAFDSPTPAAASAFLRSFSDRIAPVVKKAGIKVD
jgi:tripartite-type tricarboxylate transporter receptor subunit TctC